MLLNLERHYKNMKNEQMVAWVVFRVIVAIIFAIVVFGVVFGLAFGRLMMFYSGWVWDLLGILLIVWFISWIFRWPWHKGYWREHENRILRRRYMRGEITEAQFKRMTKVLEKEQKS
jgi:uncharacterized membrane protein